jgi:hypothetical protein
MINEHRDRGIIEARTRGVGAAEVASQFNVSRRTVFRVMEMEARKRREAVRVRVPLYLRRRGMEEETRCA